MNRKYFMITAVWMLLAVLLTGCGNSAGDDVGDAGNDGTTQTATDEADTELLTGKHHVEIVIKDKGSIFVELDADVAPITVTNFVNLASSGYYDGKNFHRIIAGFMMQGGSAAGNGASGTEPTIKGEFSANGVENNISHTRGVISMARAQDYNSGSTQFFIMHADSPSLDGAYAAFGHVTEGMDIVDDICENAEVIDNNGTVKDGTQPIMETVRVID